MVVCSSFFRAPRCILEREKCPLLIITRQKRPMLQARIQNLRRAPLWFDMFFAPGVLHSEKRGGDMRGVIYVDILFLSMPSSDIFCCGARRCWPGASPPIGASFWGAAAAGLSSLLLLLPPLPQWLMWGGKNRQRGAHRIRQLPGAQCARLPEMLLLVCVSEHCAFRRGICGYILWCGAECQHQ